MKDNDQTLHIVAIYVPTEDGHLEAPHQVALSRVPQAGEYVCLAGDPGLCHKVITVVHCVDAPCVAEIVTESKGLKLADVLGSRGPS
jgi:hypothetical protein